MKNDRKQSENVFGHFCSLLCGHRKRKINQRIEKILQFLYTVIRTANILIYIVPEQSAMTFLFQGANSARAVSVILVLGRRSSR